MKAVVYRQIRQMPQIAELPEPLCPSDAVVVAVRMCPVTSSPASSIKSALTSMDGRWVIA